MNDVQKAQSSNALPRTLMVAVCLSVALFLALESIFIVIHHDSGWLFFATKKWLEGATLYKEIIEVNPPLIFFILSPAVLLERLTEFPPAITLRLYYIVLLSIICLGISYQLSRLELARRERSIISVALLLIVFCLPINNLGQRDHLAIMFLLPYFLSRVLNSLHLNLVDGPAWNNILQFGIGVIAGMSIALKPHYVFLPLICEIWVLYQMRSLTCFLTPQTAGAVFTGLLFASFLISDPTYVSEMVPIANATYFTYNMPLWYRPWPFLIVVTVVAIILGMRLAENWQRQLSLLFSFLSLGSIGSFLLQARLDYHLLPFYTLACINWLMLTVFFRQQLSNNGALKRVKLLNGLLVTIAILSILASLLIFTSVRSKISQAITQQSLPSLEYSNQPHLQKSIEDLNEYFTGETVYGLGSFIVGSSVVENYSKAKWASGFPALWPLPAIAIAEMTPEKLAKEQRDKITAVTPLVINRISDEIRSKRPIAMIIDTSEMKGRFPAGFDFFDYFNSKPELQGLLDNYIETKITLAFEPKTHYTVYVRDDYSRLDEIRLLDKK